MPRPQTRCLGAAPVALPGGRTWVPEGRRRRRTEVAAWSTERGVGRSLRSILRPRYTRRRRKVDLAWAASRAVARQAERTPVSLCGQQTAAYRSKVERAWHLGAGSRLLSLREAMPQGKHRQLEARRHARLVEHAGEVMFDGLRRCPCCSGRRQSPGRFPARGR
jgi:hypothetical protein